MGPFITTDMTIYQALRKATAKFSKLPALTLGEATLSYDEVGRRVEKLARGLKHLGVGPGDKVAFLLPSGLDAPIVFFAPAALGGVIVPVNPVYRPKEIQHILSDSEASVVIAEPHIPGNDLVAVLESIRPSLPNLQHILLRGQSAPGMMNLDDLGGEGEALPDKPVTADALAALIYTSGTTGVPKAVMHSHSSMIAALSHRQAASGDPLGVKLSGVARLVRRYGVRLAKAGRGQLSSIAIAPLHSLIGYGVYIYGMLEGAHIIIADRFHPARILELIEKHKVKALGITPTMLTAMLESPDLKRRDLSSLIVVYIGSAPASPELVRRARAELGCPVMIAFGATETGGAVMMGELMDPDNKQAETVGRLVPGMEAKIVDDDHCEVARGQVGELAVRLSSNMLGYYKAPELTAKTLTPDGWYYTGDLASMDERGYFRIVGRKKDMIIRGGQNIFPAEIETHLLARPGVENAAVVGVPDRIAGERVWAFVLPREGVQISPEEILAYLRSDIAAFKVPDQVRVVTSLPVTTTGKVQKFILRDQALQELGQ